MLPEFCGDIRRTVDSPLLFQQHDAADEVALVAMQILWPEAIAFLAPDFQTLVALMPPSLRPKPSARALS
jgi:hypothetical protein